MGPQPFLTETWSFLDYWGELMHTYMHTDVGDDLQRQETWKGRNASIASVFLDKQVAIISYMIDGLLIKKRPGCGRLAHRS